MGKAFNLGWKVAMVAVGSGAWSGYAFAEGESLKITTPARPAYINAATDRVRYPVTGTCEDRGGVVRMTSPLALDLPCVKGRFSAQIDVSGRRSGAFSLRVEQDVAGDTKFGGHLPTIHLQDDVTVNVDLVPPTITFNTQNIDLYTVNRHSMQIRCSDVAQPIEVTAGGAVVYRGRCALANQFYEVNLDLGEIADGNLQIQVRHEDAAGNPQTASQQRNKSMRFTPWTQAHSVDRAGHRYLLGNSSVRNLVVCEQPTGERVGMIPQTVGSGARSAVSKNGQFLLVFGAGGFQRIAPDCSESLGGFALPSEMTSADFVKVSDQGQIYAFRSGAHMGSSDTGPAHLLRYNLQGALISQASYAPDLCDSLSSSWVAEIASFQVNPDSGKAFLMCSSTRMDPAGNSTQFINVAEVGEGFQIGAWQAVDTLQFIYGNGAESARMEINGVGDLMVYYGLNWQGAHYIQARTLRGAIWSARTNLMVGSTNQLVIPDDESFVIVAESLTQTAQNCGRPANFRAALLSYVRAGAALSPGSSARTLATAAETVPAGGCRLELDRSTLRLDDAGHSYGFANIYDGTYWAPVLMQDPNANASILQLLGMD
ncbi:MAG: hypothetical protein AB7F66_12260 [Bacteriovoracia bacterium]